MLHRNFEDLLAITLTAVCPTSDVRRERSRRRERDAPEKVLETLVASSGRRVLDVRRGTLDVETPTNKVGVPFAHELQIRMGPVIAHDADEHVLLVVLYEAASLVSQHAAGERNRRTRCIARRCTLRERRVNVRGDSVGERVVSERLAKAVDKALLHFDAAAKDEGEDPVHPRVSLGYEREGSDEPLKERELASRLTENQSDDSADRTS